MKLEKLIKKKNEILAQLMEIGDMRKGSITEQVFKKKNKDGETIVQGPYIVYSYNDRKLKKTISKRLSDIREVEIYKAEIDEFRRYKKLCTELANVSQQICDAREPTEKKTNKSTHR